MAADHAVSSDIHFVEVAPTPVLPGFERLHDRVSYEVRVLARVLAKRGVTTADMTAGEAHPQFEPGRA